jgi:hypothetical protein
MEEDVHNFLVECDVCQRNKGETVKYPRTLQPLLIPPSIWRDISMDFIVGCHIIIHTTTCQFIHSTSSPHHPPRVIRTTSMSSYERATSSSILPCHYPIT